MIYIVYIVCNFFCRLSPQMFTCLVWPPLRKFSGGTTASNIYWFLCTSSDVWMLYYFSSHHANIYDTNSTPKIPIIHSEFGNIAFLSFKSSEYTSEYHDPADMSLSMYFKGTTVHIFCLFLLNSAQMVIHRPHNESTSFEVVKQFLWKQKCASCVDCTDWFVAFCSSDKFSQNHVHLYCSGEGNCKLLAINNDFRVPFWVKPYVKGNIICLNSVG